SLRQSPRQKRRPRHDVRTGGEGMNIYRCVSEQLLYRHRLLDDGTGPIEPYCIAAVVAAETRGQAKWMAWQTDDSFDGSICDMPKFSVVMTRKGINLPKGVISNPKRAWWDSPSEIRQFWRERKAS